MGTLKLFRDIGLEYKEMKSVKKDWILPILKGGTVIFGGGGAWCDNRESSLWALKKSKNISKKIVLPSTYEKNCLWGNMIFQR